jgi:proline dehydrogenase
MGKCKNIYAIQRLLEKDTADLIAHCRATHPVFQVQYVCTCGVGVGDMNAQCSHVINLGAGWRSKECTHTRQ